MVYTQRLERCSERYAGSTPVLGTVTEAEVVEALGCEPSGSGFKSRPSPQLGGDCCVIHPGILGILGEDQTVRGCDGSCGQPLLSNDVIKCLGVRVPPSRFRNGPNHLAFSEGVRSPSPPPT